MTPDTRLASDVGGVSAPRATDPRYGLRDAGFRSGGSHRVFRLSHPAIAPHPHAFALAALALTLVLTGCGNMKRQNYLRPEEPSLHLPRGTSAQLPPAHTVPHRGEPRDVAFATGERDGKLVTTIPIPVTRELLERGRDRFDIYCAVCHGPDGYGRGIVVRRGFPAPPSYHDPRLRNVPVGHFFQVMTRGFGAMYPYADRLTPNDRWAVAAYIRALQLSQHADVRDLAEADRRSLSAAEEGQRHLHPAGVNLCATRNAGDDRVADQFSTFSGRTNREPPNAAGAAGSGDPSLHRTSDTENVRRGIPIPPAAVRADTGANLETANSP